MTEDKQFLVVRFPKTPTHSSHAVKSKIESVDAGVGSDANEWYLLKNLG